ncbi:MAG: response regulator [Myxococcota bacterium]|nr:response regulator [Myxococcota bacterium]
MSANRTEPKRLLIIDDSEVLLARMKRALTLTGFEVITSTQVVGNARHLVSCDLILIDYHMPGLNGSAVVHSLRSVAKASKHPCAFYVYTSDRHISNDYAALGFDGAFTSKGDDGELVRQAVAYFRLATMRSLRKSGPKEP